MQGCFDWIVWAQDTTPRVMKESNMNHNEIKNKKTNTQSGLDVITGK